MIEQEACRLRLMGPGDKERVYQWRNSERIRSVMFNHATISPQEHVMWFEKVLNTNSNNYLIFELAGRPVGVVNFPQADVERGICRWGFYKGELDTPQGTGMAMGVMGLEHAFGPLKLQKIIGQTLLINTHGIRLHENLQFVRSVEPKVHEGSTEKFIEFTMDKNRWEKVRAGLAQTIFKQPLCDPRLTREKI